ncbi:MAG: tetratricopeptide repeat protein [Gemmatimonadales bacterium]
MIKARSSGIVAALVVALAAGPAAGQQGSEAEVRLQAAVHQELVVGDLQQAIELYREIVANGGADRSVVAQALLYLGRAYEKLGSTEARTAYQRVLRDYPDQGDMVAQARTRLAALTRAATAVAMKPEMTVRRVWTETRRLDIDGRVSNDGRYIPLEDEETGDLLIRDLLTGENRRLTHNTLPKTQDLDNAEISPDGRWVAYSWDDAEGVESLRLIGIDGSAPRILYRNPEVISTDPEDWSPDGKRILARFRRADRTWQLVWVDVADGSVEVLKSVGWWDYPNAFVSPDGRYIAYDMDPDEDNTSDDIFLLAADGSSEIRVAQTAADEDVVGWTADGTKLLFVSDRLGGGPDCRIAPGICREDLWVIDIADGQPQGSPRLVRTNIEEPIMRGLTPGGAFYYTPYARRAVDVYVSTLDLETGEVVARPTRVSDRFAGASVSPVWSPDGKYLAYSNGAITRNGSMLPEDAAALMIRTLETGEERTISLPHHLRPLVWSPDGRSILAEGFRPQVGDETLALINVETGAVTTVTTHTPRGRTGTYDLPLGWSPDEEAIYLRRTEFDIQLPFASGPTEFQLLEHDLASGREREMYRGVLPNPFYRVVLSADRQHVVFASPGPEGSGQVLKMVPVTGGEGRVLFSVQPSERIRGQTLNWTPDGRYLLVGTHARRGPQARVTHLWRIPVEDGEAQRLGLTIESAPNSGVRLQVHPDGRRLAFHSSRVLPGAGELWVMEHFLPALERER